MASAIDRIAAVATLARLLGQGAACLVFASYNSSIAMSRSACRSRAMQAHLSAAFASLGHSGVTSEPRVGVVEVLVTFARTWQILCASKQRVCRLPQCLLGRH